MSNIPNYFPEIPSGPTTSSYAEQRYDNYQLSKVKKSLEYRVNHLKALVSEGESADRSTDGLNSVYIYRILFGGELLDSEELAMLEPEDRELISRKMSESKLDEVSYLMARH